MVVVMLEEPHALLVEGVSPSSAAAEHFVQNQVDRMALADLCFVTFLDFVSHARFRGSEDGVLGVVGDVGQAVGGAEGRFQLDFENDVKLAFGSAVENHVRQLGSRLRSAAAWLGVRSCIGGLAQVLTRLATETAFAKPGVAAGELVVACVMLGERVNSHVAQRVHRPTGACGEVCHTAEAGER